MEYNLHVHVCGFVIKYFFFLSPDSVDSFSFTEGENKEEV